MSSLIGQTVSHYKILEYIGGGGMGVVYKAEDTRLKRAVALKFLPPELTRDPEAKERFVHEAQAASALQHANICVVHDIDETADGQMFISMEHLDGETFKKKIERGPLKIEDAVDIAIQVAQGLAKAHEHGIVHRDIKPANIMITSDGVAKIVDFGLAKLSRRTMLTRTGSTLGTAAYMSPEQARGEPADQRTDIWSLGVMIYEMVTGQLPFKSDYHEALVYSVLNETQEPVTALRSGVPMGLEHVVRKCLEKKSADRYQHTVDLIVDLRQLAKEPHPRGIIAGLPATTDTRRHRRGGWIVLALGALATVCAGIWFLVLHRESSTESPGYAWIAVLPFTSISKAPDDEMFAEGFHDHLLTQLHGVRGFRVISRQSVIQYKQSQKRSRDIALELGVAMLMEGSVLRVGNKVRVEAQLIDGKTEGHIWSHTYDGDFRDIFKVQGDIAQHIAASLRVALASGEKESLERPITNNKEAYEFYLKGNHFWENYESRQANDTAIAMYERATREDPDFLHAYAMTAIACFEVANNAAGYGVQPGPYVWKGEIALERAMALDRDNWMALRAQARHLKVKNENEQALAVLERALDRQPHNADILEDLGMLLLRMRRLEEALPVFTQQYGLNPKGLHSGIWIGYTYWKMRRWDDALKWFDLIIAQKPEYLYGYSRKANVLVDGFGNLDKARSVLDEGLLRVKDCNWRWELLSQKFSCAFIARDFVGALAILASKEFEGSAIFRPLQMGHAYRMMGKQQEALKCYTSVKDTLEGLTSQRPGDPDLHMQLSLVYGGLRRKEEALREGRRAIELAPLGEDLWLGEQIRVDFARVNVMVGEFDVAITHLDTLLSIPSQMTVWRLKLDPWYDAIRSNPRFKALLAKSK